MVVTHHTDRIADSIMGMRDYAGSHTLEHLADSLDIDFHQHSAYHIAKSIAHAQGTLTVDEAYTVSMNLGSVWNSENGGWARRADPAAKVVITKLMGRLMQLDDPRNDSVDGIPLP